MPCSAVTCPFAELVTTSTGPVLVNTAPHSGSLALLGMINANAPSLARVAGYQGLSFLTGAQVVQMVSGWWAQGTANLAGPWHERILGTSTNAKVKAWPPVRFSSRPGPSAKLP